MSGQIAGQNGSLTNLVVVSVKMPEQTREQFRELAEKQHRSLSGHVRFLIERELEKAA